MWRLRPKLTACVASDKVILLDEEGDRYFTLPEVLEVAAVEWLRRGDGSVAPASLRSLDTASEGRSLRNDDRVHVDRPQLHDPGLIGFRSTRTPILSVAITVTRTWFALRLRRLHLVLDGIRRHRSRGADIDRAELLRRAALFAGARRWCPLKPNCLLDSLALYRWMGCPTNADVIFGVVARPFEAHCWVQSGSRVLSDSYDRVSRYEPILAL